MLFAAAGPLTYTLVALLAVFGVGDLIAKLTHYKFGETFSALDKHLENKHWWLTAINAAILVALFLHLVLQLF
jgi:hypothetical protein